MKKLHVIAAGLGWNVLESRGITRLAGLDFSPANSVFPAVTCTAQAHLRTGLDTSAHGVVGNGWWSDDLRRPLFWDQSCHLVHGDRVWRAQREAGAKIGLFFLQQSLGEDVDCIVSPAPIHKHGGGMIMSCYTKPSGLSPVLERLNGKFPLYRYWGPLAAAKVGRACIDWFEAFTDIHDIDEAYLYLPTLDYAAQKRGPGSGADNAAFREFRRQLERLADLCMHRGAELVVEGDYAITPVTEEPVMPNVFLRRGDFFKVRIVGDRAYPDFYQSTAFAMCDHELCHVYGEQREAAANALMAVGLIRSETQCEHERSITMLAPQGSWCDYRWWTDSREAPDYASHVDIHNKPGYDPHELFFFCRGTVRGTHGRACLVARSQR